jgi:hypothetical protein
MGAKMLKFPIPERQEINLEFEIKVFVGSKIWYFNKFYSFLNFQKFGVVTETLRERGRPWLNVASGPTDMRK